MQSKTIRGVRHLLVSTGAISLVLSVAAPAALASGARSAQPGPEGVTVELCHNGHLIAPNSNSRTNGHDDDHHVDVVVAPDVEDVCCDTRSFPGGGATLGTFPGGGATGGEFPPASGAVDPCAVGGGGSPTGSGTAGSGSIDVGDTDAGSGISNIVTDNVGSGNSNDVIDTNEGSGNGNAGGNGLADGTPGNSDGVPGGGNSNDGAGGNRGGHAGVGGGVIVVERPIETATPGPGTPDGNGAGRPAGTAPATPAIPAQPIPATQPRPVVVISDDAVTRPVVPAIPAAPAAAPAVAPAPQAVAPATPAASPVSAPVAAPKAENEVLGAVTTRTPTIGLGALDPGAQSVIRVTALAATGANTTRLLVSVGFGLLFAGIGLQVGAGQRARAAERMT